VTWNTTDSNKRFLNKSLSLLKENKGTGKTHAINEYLSKWVTRFEMYTTPVTIISRSMSLASH
jgi:hypothetical protein